MDDRDDVVHTVTIGSHRRTVLVLLVAGTALLATVVLSWPDDRPDEPAAMPTTTTLPTAVPFPALAGQRLLVRSTTNLVFDFATGALATAPNDVVWEAGWRIKRGVPSVPTVLASSAQHLAVSRCDGAECGIAVVDAGTAETLRWLPGTRGPGGRAAFSPDGRHLGYYLGEAGPGGVTLWRVVVLDLETGERAEAGPWSQGRFVVFDGGRYVVSSMAERLIVADTQSGRLTTLALQVPVEDIQLYA